MPQEPEPAAERTGAFTGAFGRAFLLLYVFLSGFCSLTYQIIWERRLKSVFGGDIVSASIIVAVFLLGLGLGGLAFRRPRPRPLLVLAGLEAAIGIIAFASFDLIPRIGDLASSMVSGRGSGGSLAAGALGSALFLAVPTLLMGGTLPLIFQAFAPVSGNGAGFIGRVYGVNVLGAFAGTLLPLSAFGTLGLPAVLEAAGAVNIGLALGLLALASKRRGALAAPPPPVEKEDPRRGSIRFLAGFAFLSGFVALSIEILLLRFIGLLQGQSAYTFPIILSAYLLAMAAGSIVWSAASERMRAGGARALPFALQAAVGSILPLAIVIFTPLLRGEYAAYFNFPMMFKLFGELLESGRFLLALRLAGQFSLPLLILVAPVVFVSGGIFPALIKAMNRSGRPLGQATGLVYFWNSLGCAAGSLASGFLLIPNLGWYGSIAAISALSLAGGFFGVRESGRSAPRPMPAPRGRAIGIRIAAASLAVLLPAGAFLLMDSRLPYEIAAGKRSGYVAVEGYREGPTGVAVAVKESRPRGTVVDIYEDGILMSELPSPRFSYIANLPRLQENLASVLILGLGGGQNVADLLSDPRVRRLVVVDWSGEIIELVSTRPVAKYNRAPFDDRRLRIVKADARLAVRLFAREGLAFDAVINNLGFPSWSGAGGLTSVEFFRAVRDILAPDGFYYHVPNAANGREWDLVQDTLAAVFARIAVHNDRIMICGAKPYAPRPERIAQILTREMRKRTDPYLAPPDAPDDRLAAEFRARLAVVAREDLPNIGILTDAVPAAEYPISLGGLWRMAVKGRTDPSPAPPVRARR
jgi:spermidine synthase